MYSMMLMMAASPAGDSAAFHGRFLAHHSCHGCYGSASVAPAGCCGGCCGGWGASYRPAYGCCGGGAWGASYGGYSIYGMGYGAGPAVVFTPYGTTNLNPPDGSEKATIRVELPKDAKLFIDGREVGGTGVSRSYATPALPRGADFY